MGRISHWLCKFGLHKWTLREIHWEEPYRETKDSVLMSILERCECGAKRFAPRGYTMPTVHICSSKYIQHEENKENKENGL